MNIKVRQEQFSIAMKQGVCDVYSVQPKDLQVHSAVLFLMDAFGPRPCLYEMADRIASLGFYVFLPNLFYRDLTPPYWSGGAPLSVEKIPEVAKVVIPLAKNYSSSSAMALEDAQIFLDFMLEKKKIRTGSFAATGYCMGGSVALRLAAAFPDQFAAMASFHAGQLVTQSTDSPHLGLPKVQAELYFAHADKDPSMTAEQIEKLSEALKAGPIFSKSEIYDGAAHGFAMKDLPVYQERALERYWQKLTALLQRNLPRE